MAELVFSYGTMNCGKSTMALQIHHNAVAAGKHVRLYTKLDRGGTAVSSRLGLSQPATQVTDDLDLRADLGEVLAAGGPIDELICDEVQFYSPQQVGQLARIVDELDIEVHAFGLLTDFTSRLFPGSQRLLELADRRQELQVAARCWCGDRGSQNARTVDGQIQRAGAQVVVGDVDAGEVTYEVLCRRHFREGITRATADHERDTVAAVDRAEVHAD